MCGESAKIIVATVPGPVSHSYGLCGSEGSFSRAYICVWGGGGGKGVESD